MRRACKLTLKFITKRKRSAIMALLQGYRSAVNFYIRSLWSSPGKLDADTLSRLPAGRTRLSARYKSQALKQAIETVVGTQKAARVTNIPGSAPRFNGAMTLDAKFVTIEQGRGSFDTVIRLSCLAAGKRLALPTKATAMLRKWLAEPDAKLIQGCSLSAKALVVWVEIPDQPLKTVGDVLGIDIGMVKLIATSAGQQLGTAFKDIRDRVVKHAAGSIAKRSAIRARDQYVRETVNQLPWATLRTIAIEDLKNLKKGKSTRRGKAFRRAAAPWVYRQVIEVIQQKAQQYRVRVVAVSPAYTSQTCPPCGHVSRDNRKAENFECVNCGYRNDADTVGAINVLNKALLLLGSVESPRQLNSEVGLPTF